MYFNVGGECWPTDHDAMSLSIPPPPPRLFLSWCCTDDSENEQKKQTAADRVRRQRRSYLLVVVVGQTLTIKPHPPPLKYTISAKKKEGKTYLRKPKIFVLKAIPSLKVEANSNRLVICPAQVLIFHHHSHRLINVRNRSNSCQLSSSK